MKLILEAIKSLFRKMETSITKATATVMAAIPKKLTELENDLVDVDGIAQGISNAQTTADAAHTAVTNEATAREEADATKMSATNPVGTGSFSMNRKGGTTVGDYSHTEGNSTTASGEHSHAEGAMTIASAINSHAEGCYTLAASQEQHVQGRFNIRDSADIYAHIVGNGTSVSRRSNAHTLDWNGNAWYAGTVEGTALILPSSTADSTKKFKIIVDDSGTLTATEVT